MPANLEHLIARKRRAWSTYQAAASRLQQLAEFILPYQSNITAFGAEGRPKTLRLYNARGIHAADKLARTMHGTVTPSAFEWHSPVFRQAELNDVKPLRAWLQECSKRMYAARRQSNFGMEVGRFYASGCALATACLYVEEARPAVPGRFAGLQYAFVPIGGYAIEQNAAGRIDTLFRDVRMPLRDAAARFGATLGDEWLRQLPQKPDHELTIVHAIYPRLERDERRPGGKHMPIASCYLLEAGPQGPKILSEGGFQEQAFAVWRWDVAQREIWGTGPGHIAYPDIRSLNRIRELKLQAGAGAVYPAVIKTDKVLLTEVNLSPGAVMRREEGTGPALEAFDTKAKFDVANLLEEDLNQAIDAMYYILELMLPDKPTMTLGEVERRIEERQRLLGPTMSRLEGEFLNPLFEREFGLMLRGGAFPTPPPELLEVADQADIDVEWEGPLARAQRGGELLSIDRLNQHVFTVGAQRPDVLDTIDWDGQVKRYAEVTGYPADLLVDERVVKQVRAQRAQQEQAKQQAAMLMQGARAAGQAAPALTALHEAAQPQGGGG